MGRSAALCRVPQGHFAGRDGAGEGGGCGRVPAAVWLCGSFPVEREDRRQERVRKSGRAGEKKRGSELEGPDHGRKIQD